jgi:hypothetical protein
MVRNRATQCQELATITLDVIKVQAAAADAIICALRLIRSLKLTHDQAQRQVT